MPYKYPLSEEAKEQKRQQAKRRYLRLKESGLLKEKLRLERIRYAANEWVREKAKIKYNNNKEEKKKYLKEWYQKNKLTILEKKKARDLAKKLNKKNAEKSEEIKIKKRVCKCDNLQMYRYIYKKIGPIKKANKETILFLESLKNFTQEVFNARS